MIVSGSAWRAHTPSSLPPHKGHCKDNLCGVSADDMDSRPVSESSFRGCGWPSISIELREESSLSESAICVLGVVSGLDVGVRAPLLPPLPLLRALC